MALIRIGDEYKVFDILPTRRFTIKTLTLSEEDYLNYPDVDKYDCLITEKRIIFRFTNQLYDTPYDYNSCVDHIDGSCSVNKFIIGTRRELHHIYRYEGFIHTDSRMELFTGPRIAMKDRFYKKLFRTSCHSIYYLDGEYYFEVNYVSTKLDHEDDRLVTHLYSNGMFIATAFRNNYGELMITKRKIIDHRMFHGHLLVLYQTQQCLILLCYSSFYEFPYNDAPMKINTKSAKKIIH
jgi:hypothetical protein